jgi:biopolymer transport protein ExbD
MPSVKIPKKSTDTDMTPFVDIGFLILSFFIMATKFKPKEPVPITTPNSVNTTKLPDNNAVMISIDKDNKVYFSVFAKKDPTIADEIVRNVALSRNINLSDAEVKNFRNSITGMPVNKLKGFLAYNAADQSKVAQDGIPVLDSASNELVWWIAASERAFAGQELQYLIKGDGDAKYPTFKGVIDALKRNDKLKYQLVTMPEAIPAGAELLNYNREREALAPKK